MLELKNIGKKFGDTQVLKDVNLKIKEGEILSILGPSGCGKTTLLNIILGMIQPTEGQIVFNEKDITTVPMKDRNFNIVFQDYALFPNLNVYENITYGLKNTPGVSSEEEVDSLLELLNITDHLDKSVSELSGGQKQRVAIARTLVMKPQILLLDEPLSALDGIIKEQIKERIHYIAKEYNLTTIIVTHDPEEALTLSDKVVILNEGNVEQFSSSEEIVSRPESQFIEDFIINQLIIKKNNILNLFPAEKLVVN